MDSASDLIVTLGLQPHPEGGWFREIHRSTERVDTTRGPRAALTTIYYLLERTQISRWHVVTSDEVWHFYAGSPLELLVYQPVPRVFERHVLASPSKQHQPVGIVRAGEWQAARSQGAWSLVGCNVGPGFEFTDFSFVSALAGHEEHFTGEMATLRDLL